MSVIKTLKAGIAGTANRLGYEIRNLSAPPPQHYLELDENYADIIKAVRPYTMTTCERIRALVDSTRYVVRKKMPGVIVECGVWRGGSMMTTALTLLKEGDVRDLFLLDTFAGMTAPTEHDVDWGGVPAQGQYIDSKSENYVDWCYASLEDVRRNLLSTGYPEERVHFVKGDVLKTLPHEGIGELALLRLDTDWYESTLHELKWLYPKLVPGGILIIDDYGYWQGCHKAVDEYFGPSGPFMCALDSTGMLVVKPVA